MSKRPEKPKNLPRIVCKHIEDGKYLDSSHAYERKQQRSIIQEDITHVLTTENWVKRHDVFREDHGRWTYAFEGLTTDNYRLRVVVAFQEQYLVIVTAYFV